MAAKHLPETLKNTILIAGASGLVARSMKYAFESIGCKVISVSTQEGNPDTISWNDVKNVGLPEKTTAVINACGKSMFAPQLWNQSLVDQIYDSRVGTNLILREAILKAEHKPKMFITMSGVGIYKPDPSIVHNEDSKEYANDFWTKLVVDWENAAKLPDTISTKTVMLRSGVVLSRHGGMLRSMYTQFRLGFGGIVGTGEHYMPYIHIRDLVKLAVFCVETGRLEGPVNAVSPHHITNKEFSQTLAKTLSRPCLFRTPEFIFTNFMSKERASIILGSVKVYPKKALDKGFEFLYFDTPTLMSVMRENV